MDVSHALSDPMLHVEQASVASPTIVLQARSVPRNPSNVTKRAAVDVPRGRTPPPPRFAPGMRRITTQRRPCSDELASLDPTRTATVEVTLRIPLISMSRSFARRAPATNNSMFHVKQVRDVTPGAMCCRRDQYRDPSRVTKRTAPGGPRGHTSPPTQDSRRNRASAHHKLRPCSNKLDALDASRTTTVKATLRVPVTPQCHARSHRAQQPSTLQRFT